VARSSESTLACSTRVLGLRRAAVRARVPDACAGFALGAAVTWIAVVVSPTIAAIIASSASTLAGAIVLELLRSRQIAARAERAADLLHEARRCGRRLRAAPMSFGFEHTERCLPPSVVLRLRGQSGERE
jgi:hypothetical protein